MGIYIYILPQQVLEHIVTEYVFGFYKHNRYQQSKNQKPDKYAKQVKAYFCHLQNLIIFIM